MAEHRTPDLGFTDWIIETVLHAKEGDKIIVRNETQYDIAEWVIRSVAPNMNLVLVNLEEQSSAVKLERRPR